MYRILWVLLTAVSLAAATPFRACGEWSRECGMFGISRHDGKVYWLIPDTLLGREMSLTTTVLKVPARKSRTGNDKFGYSGDRFTPRILSFVRRGDRVAVYQHTGYIVPDTETSGLSALYAERNACSLLTEFPVEADSPAGAVKIDVTEWIQDDNLFGLGSFGFILKLGLVDAGSIRQTDMLVCPDALIVRSVRSYAPLFARSGNEGTSPWEIGTCLQLLPERPMQVRYATPRVGYYTMDFTGTKRGQLVKRPVVKRWRLEVADADTARYNRGELVEPVQKIRFAIDPAFPKEWVAELRKAVLNWNPVFEAAGFKQVLEVYEGGKDIPFMPDDSRYSWVVYKLSPMENAYGKAFSDPRSGEILSCHISIFHAVFQLLQQWYTAQTGEPVADMPEEAMRELLEMMLTHEVGHTLGLEHNFYGSSLFSVAELRDRELMRKYSHSSSIMDYSRINYVAEAGDSIPFRYRIPRIGAYDTCAIAWGYRFFAGKEPEEEEALLTAWIKEKQRAERYRFQGENHTYPAAQAEDLGSNPVETAECGMKRLERLGENRADSWEAKLQERARLSQYRQYVGHALVHVGGYQACRENDSLFRRPVFAERQRQALAFLDKWVLSPPAWVPETVFEEQAEETIRELLEKAGRFPEQSGYTRADYLGDVQSMIGKRIDRQMSPAVAFLLRTYAQQAVAYCRQAGTAEWETVALLKGQLKTFRRAVNAYRSPFWNDWKVFVDDFLNAK